MFVAELPFKPVGIWMICFLAAIVLFWRSFGAQSDNTQSEQAYLLIKQSLVVISTDIQRLFERYLHPPGRRFGIIKPLTLVEVTSMPQRTEACFCSEIMV